MSSIAADPRAFTVGVLRRDGVVIPIAAFDGKRWEAVWPDPQSDPEVPIDLRNVPKKWWGPAGPFDAWQALTAAPAPVTLHVRQPDLVPAHCLRQVGLRTDYRPAEPPPPFDERPYPKDGIAVAPPRQVDRIEILGARSPEWTEFLPLVDQGFNKIENGLGGPDESSIKRELRKATKPTIEAIYAYGSDPRVYVVEAAREYWSEPKINECLAVAFGHVWLVREHGVVKPLKSTVDVQGCDRPNARYMLPFGVIEAGGHLFWIAQFAGWDVESYEVIEIGRDNATLVVGRFGGAC
ncbi:MAG TPA: hypothetical protein VGJ29_09805 [Vicinamibacterales bacterium]